VEFDGHLNSSRRALGARLYIARAEPLILWKLACLNVGQEAFSASYSVQGRFGVEDIADLLAQQTVDLLSQRRRDGTSLVPPCLKPAEQIREYREPSIAGIEHLAATG
jgi:hypothetical protein